MSILDQDIDTPVVLMKDVYTIDVKRLNQNYHNLWPRLRKNVIPQLGEVPVERWTPDNVLTIINYLCCKITGENLYGGPHPMFTKLTYSPGSLSGRTLLGKVKMFEYAQPAPNKYIKEKTGLLVFWTEKY